MKKFFKTLFEITKEKSSVEKWLDTANVVLAAMLFGGFIATGNMFVAICWGIVTLLDMYNLILHS